MSARPVITQGIDETNLVSLAGNTRPEATAQNDRGAVADGFPMAHMLLQLRRPPEQESTLEQFLDELEDPRSPNFHKWLSPGQFGQSFGAAQQDLDTISEWLQSQGFTVNAIYPSRMVIDFSGNAGQIRQAFHTEIHKLDVGGINHIANMSDPQIPAAMAPAVIGIVSLHDFTPRAQHEMRSPKANYTTTSGDNLMVPADLATIYNLNPLFNAGYSGQGQTIAVIEDTDVFATSDWDIFRSTFGLSSYTSGSFSTIHPAPLSGTNNCADPGVLATNEGEAIIDAEWASASAPSAAIVLASCADTTTFGGLIALQNLINGSQPPALVSVSYSECEAENLSAANAAYNAAYQQAVSEGVSVFVSAGDSGAAGCDDKDTNATHGIGVNALASTAYNVAVGGTDFSDTYSGTNNIYWGSTNGATYGSALSYIPEIPWNDSCAGRLLSNYVSGSETTYGSNGFCNSSKGQPYLTTAAGSGGPSGCATGSPSAGEGIVSGSCQGWPKPSWQAALSNLGNPNDGVRDLPDVSLFAANGVWGHYYLFCWSDTSNGGAVCGSDPSNWSGAGGTSFASPIMAGIQALVNQETGQSQGNPNSVYYQLAATEYNGSSTSCNSSNGNGVASACVFYDVTQGDMDVNCTGSHNCYRPSGKEGVLSTSNGAYDIAYGTTTGWDFATGIGSVNAANLASSWPNPPMFTSAASATFVAGVQGTFTVTATGTPAPTLTESGSLPSGVTFNTTTGVLSGIPSSNAGGIYNITFTASNGVGTNATQNFTLTVDQAPAITSANGATFTVGSAGTFTVTATGFPSPTLSESGALPNGVTFNATTGVLGGTPASGTAGNYNISFTASNGVGGNAVQSFSLTVATSTPATLSFVQVNAIDPATPQSSVSVAYTASQTAGDLNVVVVGWSDSTTTISSVADSAGNNYFLAVGPTVQSGTATQAIFYAPNIAAAAANTNRVTVTFSAAANYPDIRIAEYSGLSSSNPFDVAVAAQGTSTSSSSGSATTTNANDLLVGANLVQTTTTAAGTGYTRRVITNPDGDILEDQIVTATGSYSATAPVAPSGPWIMQMVAFRAAGSGAGMSLSITGVSPPSGPVGTSVTVTGTNFGSTQGTSTVTFNGTVATPTSWSATSIVAPVPAGATTGYIVVTVGGVTSNGVAFTVSGPAPSVTSLSPSSGPVGTSVTIAGTNFGSTQGTSTLTFNGTVATPTSWSATSIVTPVPAGATSGSVVVMVGGVPSNGVNFTVSTGSGGPTLVQHVSSSSTRGISMGSPFCYYFQLPNPTTAGNAVMVGFAFSNNPTPTVTDDQGDSYAIVENYYDSVNGQSVAIAAAFNVSAGARNLSLCFSSDPGGWVQPMATELNNVVAVDGVGTGSQGTGSSASAGNLAPSISGDLAYQIVFSPPNQSSFTAGSQGNINWNLMSADLMDGWAGQYGVYNSMSAMNPTMNLGASQQWWSAAVLLQVGTTGGVPSGMRIVHLIHENIPVHEASGGNGSFPNPLPLQLPSSGNLLVAMIGGGPNFETVTSLTDTNGNSWNQAGSTYVTPDSVMVQTYFAANAISSGNLGLTLNWSGTDGDYTILFYDVTGAATSPLDTTNGAIGFQSDTSGTLTVPYTLTPAQSGELIFSDIMWDNNTGTGLTSNTGTSYFDANMFSGESLNGPEPIDENNGWGHAVSTSNSPITFTWSQLSPTTAAGNWASMAVAFLAANPNSQQVATPMFNPAAGTYSVAQSVTISDATSGAQIYYTLDGSTPSTASTLYNGTPITVSSTTTIEAVAVVGLSSSAVASANYTISGNPPAAPTLISANAVSPTEIDLAWTNPSGSNATGNSVLRCTGSSCTPTTAIASLSASATAYQDESVSPATSYTYLIQATNTWGSTSSNSLSATTTALYQAPSAISVTPNSGSGLGPQTFSYLYSDTSGYQNIYLVQTILNTTANWPGSCGTMYIAAGNSLYLMSDDGSTWMGPLTIGQPGTLQNSQCTLDAGASSASGSGTNLTVNLSLTFQSGFIGLENNFTLANDVVHSLNSGFQELGSWTPNTVTAPSTVSVTPGSGSGPGPQTFSYLYSDTSGYQNIYLVQTILNTTPSWPGSCGTMYIAASNSLYLMSDDGSTWMGPLTIGQPGTLQNSQCTLDAGASSANGSGTNLTVNLSLTFQPAFMGLESNFALANDVAHGLNSGFQNLGSWTANPVAGPSAVSVTPSSGSGLGPQTFSYLYSDTSGYQNIYLVQTILNTTANWPGSCGTMYIVASNSLYLMSDDGSTWMGPLTIGQPGTLQNSQCTLDAGASSASGSGTNLTVNLSLTFQPAFMGLKNNFMLAYDVVNNLSSGIQNRGTWTPAPIAGPSAVSVTPSSGSGLGPQTFSYLYSDTSGYQNIYLVQTIINTTANWPGSCGTMYIAASSSLYLMSDDGSTWMGPLTIGQPGTLQNSQCTLDAGASSASGSGTNLTVNLSLTFQSGFTGLQNNFMLANDVANNLTSGLQNRGSWTP